MKIWILILLTATALSAQIPYGKEFQVNTYWVGSQGVPNVAGLSEGGFVVCWMSADQDGSDFGIYAQLYKSDGAPIASEFRVNSNTKDRQEYPSVAGLSDSGFVVCWDSYQDGSGFGIYAQRFGMDGRAIGDEFRVNSSMENDQINPSVAALADGDFVVCWMSGSWEATGPDGSYFEICAQRYGADGTPVGTEFRVNSHTKVEQKYPSVAALSDGGFVVCWQFMEQDKSGEGVYAQRYGADSIPLGDEFIVSSRTMTYYPLPSVGGLTDGGFVVCWGSYGRDGSGEGVYARRFGADGKPAGEFCINSYTENDQQCSSVVGLPDGGFVACWMSWEQDGSWTGIYAQRYNTEGKTVGREFRVNSYTKDSQAYPSVAALSNGGFVACWESGWQDGWHQGTYGKRFPAHPQRHELRPFALLQPPYDATVNEGKPLLTWQAASELTVAYPWELEYTVYYDTLTDFTTASFKEAGPDTTVKLSALKLGKTYFWKVLAKTYYGDSLWSDIGAFFVSHTATDVEAEVVPGQFAVLSNYPNPFNPSTTIRFELPKDGCVTLKIYDLSGRLVKVLLSGEQTAGSHTAVWDGTDDAGCRVAAGVYFYRLEFMDANGARQVLTQKMSLVK